MPIKYLLGGLTMLGLAIAHIFFALGVLAGRNGIGPIQMQLFAIIDPLILGISVFLLAWGMKDRTGDFIKSPETKAATFFTMACSVILVAAMLITYKFISGGN